MQANNLIYEVRASLYQRHCKFEKTARFMNSFAFFWLFGGEQIFIYA